MKRKKTQTLAKNRVLIENHSHIIEESAVAIINCTNTLNLKKHKQSSQHYIDFSGQTTHTLTQLVSPYRKTHNMNDDGVRDLFFDIHAQQLTNTSSSQVNTKNSNIHRTLHCSSGVNDLLLPSSGFHNSKSQNTHTQCKLTSVHLFQLTICTLVRS